MQRASILATAATIGLAGGWGSSCQARPTDDLPVLLVHGLAWKIDGEDVTWGRPHVDANGDARVGGMVGFLEDRGLPYGGAIRPVGGRLQLPESLDTYGATAAPHDARLFVLKFSSCANTDGLAYKALELAEAIRQVRRLTGAAKVRIVAHSAGGVVARAYLQNALPGVPYRGDVDRLVTIATPHLGSAMASHFGDYLGTRATSLTPDAELIRQLDSELDLPAQTTFASIVVRGIAADARGGGDEYNDLVDHEFLDRLPVEYRLGGDQVVHVRSQNLRLARCAARYEAATGRPVQYVLARVADPSPDDHCFLETKVHMVCTGDPMVEHLVYGLIQPGALLWSRARSDQLAGWIDWQARLYANGAIEEATLREHPMSEVRNVEIDDFELLGQRDGGRRWYAFDGKAYSRNMLISLRRRWTHIQGRLDLEFDPFGRVLSARSSIE
jgi:pimeloyl-ACP methyl ester carboxylesterase